MTLEKTYVSVIEKTYLPLRKAASGDVVVQILAQVIGVLASSRLGLFPDQTGTALQRRPVVLDQLRGAVVGHEAEGMDTETVEVTDRARDTMASHGPEERVQRTGLLAEKVVRCVVGSGSLGDFVDGVWLDGVDEVGEQNRILDEKDGDVVSDDIYVV